MWSAPDWSDHGTVLRPVLPKLARALADRTAERLYAPAEIGQLFANGDWLQR